MNKKAKILLSSLGIVSILSVGSTFPVNAASNETINKKVYCSNSNYSEYIYINVNGKDCSAPIKSYYSLIKDLIDNNPSCTNKDANSSNTTTESKPSTPNVETSKPESKPDTSTESKPDTNTDNTTESKTSTPDVETAKPESKPDTNTDNTTENKPSTPSGNFASFQKEVLDLVNVERTNRGLQPLKFNAELSKVATLKSQDMIDKNYFDHTSPTYGSPFDMMKQFGITYRAAGENIAMGQETPQEVMNSWMNSPGHRKNILNPDFTELGVGIASNGSSLYWTQMFIGK